MMTSAGNAADLLQNARKLDRHAYYATRAFVNSLRPQWGGSLDHMREYAALYRATEPAEWKANCIDAMVADLEGSDRHAASPSCDCRR
jgi:hypothetical protein